MNSILGKSAWDAAFVAGFEAAKKALSDTPDLHAGDVNIMYRKVSREHGSDWKDGALSAIAISRGAYGTTVAATAVKMGLYTGGAS